MTKHKQTKEYVQYKFFPEGKESDYGIIQIDIGTLERSLIKDTDKKHASMYKGQAWRKISQYIAEGKFPETAMAAWY
ncbi:MAG: hypothetical protein Q4A54_01845 [Parabacteroides sp.]|nr:hypothetical protein [Parabacteroides sp.]